MSGFNTVEKNIAGFLSKFPNVKNRVKKLYSSINYIMYRKNYSHRSKYKIERILSEVKNESFFGYYDKSPLSPDRKHIIFHETNGTVSHLPPDPEKNVNIILYDIERSDYRKIAETTAYNWQQGSRLQWLDKDKFIFNCFENGKYISKIYDNPGSCFTTIGFPIYDCFKNEFAVSLNFSRLNELDTHYGYKNITACDLSDVKNDGIFYTDLRTGESKLILSLDEIIRLHPADGSNEEDHCVNHILISPDGRNFIFIHRWFCSGGRFDSLVMCDIDGKDPRILANDGFVSHCCWMDNENIAGYLKADAHGRAYYRINIKTLEEAILSEKLKNFGDGHPSFFGNKMLFDSYPDRSRMQHLYTYDADTDGIEEIGSFLSPLKFFGEIRCDLHPRWSSNGKNIFIDSVHEGNRNQYKLDLKEEDS